VLFPQRIQKPRHQCVEAVNGRSYYAPPKKPVNRFHRHGILPVRVYHARPGSTWSDWNLTFKFIGQSFLKGGRFFSPSASPPLSIIQESIFKEDYLQVKVVAFMPFKNKKPCRIISDRAWKSFFTSLYGKDNIQFFFVDQYVR
jgi:hypothetical protein